MTVLQLLEKPKGTDGLNFSTDENHAAQRAILNLFQIWEIAANDACILLGRGVSSKTLQRWRDGHYGNIDIDLSTRLSLFLGIHKALRMLFKDAERGYKWIKAPNSAFGGKSALEIMLSGRMTDVIAIRRYLDSERGGW